MRIGMMIGEGAGESPAIDEVIRRARRAEEVGLTTGWLAQIFSHDAINLLALVGRETTKIELGTAVVPTYPRHPAVMAQAALTTQVACEGRFTLGIGLSHKMVIDGMYGLPYKRHMAHMRDSQVQRRRIQCQYGDLRFRRSAGSPRAGRTRAEDAGSMRPRGHRNCNMDGGLQGVKGTCRPAHY